MKILVIEDEPELRQSLHDYLKQEGYTTESTDTLSLAKEKVALYAYDLIVLDIGLGEENGLDLLADLQSRLSETGVIILSAKNSLEDKIKGLNLGADDYLTKPFHYGELKARIRSIFRRRNLGGRMAIEIGNLKVSPEENLALVGGEEVELTPKEFALLVYFLTNSSRVLTKAEIAEHLWGDYADSFDNFDFIYTHIKNLRRKIAAAGGDIEIKTIYGMGYKFIVH